MIIKKKKRNHINPLSLGIASVAWLVFYTLFAIMSEFRKWIIAHGWLGPNCSGCEVQATHSVIVAIIMPLLIGAIGIGVAVAISLKRENFAIKAISGLVVTIGVFALSYYNFGMMNFAINFAR